MLGDAGGGHGLPGGPALAGARGLLQGNRRCSLSSGEGWGRPRGPPRSGLGRHLQPRPHPAGLPSPRDRSWTQQRAQLGAARPRPPPRVPARGRVRRTGRACWGVSAAGDTHTPESCTVFFLQRLLFYVEQKGKIYVTSRGARPVPEEPSPPQASAAGRRAPAHGLGADFSLEFPRRQTRTSADASA